MKKISKFLQPLNLRRRKGGSSGVGTPATTRPSTPTPSSHLSCLLVICPVAPEGWHTKGRAKKIVSTACSGYITMFLRILSHHKHHRPRPDTQPGTTQMACTSQCSSVMVVTSPQARRRAHPVVRPSSGKKLGTWRISMAHARRVWHALVRTHSVLVLPYAAGYNHTMPPIPHMDSDCNPASLVEAKCASALLSTQHGHDTEQSLCLPVFRYL
jgi:hypothetical protein